MIRARASAAALLSASVALAGCASQGKGTPELVKGIASASPSPSSSIWVWIPPPGSSTPCNVYLYGHDARLNVVSTSWESSAGECSTLARSLSGGGDFWTLQTITPGNTPSVVCAVQNGPWVVVLRDSGSQVYGQSVCSSLTQNGWSEDTGAERQAQAQDEQAAQAQASASARASDAATAQQDLSTLQADIKAFTNAQKVRDDVKTADKDLTAERQDAANGNGDNCYNVQVTVAYDAANVVGYDVNTSASYDVNNEQTGIQQLRSEVSAVQSDESKLRSDGLPLPYGMDDAISQGQSQAAQAVSTTNAAVDQLNGDLTTAYQVANAAGTGSCAGDGPGTAPNGLSHVS